MMTLKQPIKSPTVAQVSSYIQALLPIQSNDVRFVYHQPLHSSFSPTAIQISSIVFSITPTRDFYNALHAGAKLGFLHRPFDLIRGNVPRISTILASHKAFDAVLTVGYNVHLASDLKLDVNNAVTIQGYKGDPARRIGIVAPFPRSMSSGDVLAQVLAEFDHKVEGYYGFDDESTFSFQDGNIAAVAIMNAFHKDEVNRALSAALSGGFIEGEDDASRLLYLTGAVREPGLAYAIEKGVRVICVGHRQCEEWGLRFLARKVRGEFPGLQVVEVFKEEEEEKPLGSPALRQTNVTKCLNS